MAYLNSLDLIRGYAAFLVSVFHLSACGMRLTDDWLTEFCSYGGWDGVALFFMVSGFVVPYSLKYGGFSQKDIGRFMLKRIIRIDPPYFVSIIVAIALWARFRYSAEGPPLDVSLQTTALHVGYMIDVARSFGSESRWYVTVYWTLAYEFQFYLFIAITFPLVVTNSLHRRAILYFTFLGAKAFVLFGPYGSVPVFFRNAELFLLGVIFFQHKTKLVDSAELILLSLPIGMIAALESWRMAIYIPIFALLLFRYDVRTSITSFAGQISYSLYLYHDSVGGWARGALQTALGFSALEAFFGAMLISIVVAMTMYLTVERPALKLSKAIRYVSRAS